MAFSSSRIIMGSGAVGTGEMGYDLSAGDYVSFPDSDDWSWGNQDVTFEAWINCHETNSRPYIFYQGPSNNNYFYFDNSTNNCVCVGGGGTMNIQSTNFSSHTDTWVHVAAVRSSGAWKLYENGVSKTLTLNTNPSYSYTNNSGVLQMGLGQVNAATLDEIRLSNTARWTSNFTPETSPYESDSNTKLLVHCHEAKTGTTGSGATFTESGNEARTGTETGTAIEDTVLYKF